MAAAVVGAALGWAPWDAATRFWARWGIAWAWAASSAGSAALVFGQRSGQRTFWLAFGGGMLLRLALLCGLAAYAWRRPDVSSSALLGGYALAVAGLLLLESRHLLRG